MPPGIVPAYYNSVSSSLVRALNVKISPKVKLNWSCEQFTGASSVLVQNKSTTDYSKWPFSCYAKSLNSHSTLTELEET